MKFFPLIWKNMWRRKFRTTFTLLSLFVAFLLFGLLMTIRTAFSLGVDVAGLDRLIGHREDRGRDPEPRRDPRRDLGERPSLRQ